MQIAFDAKRYYHNNTGLGNYSRSLVNNMATMHPEHTYWLCNPKPSKAYSTIQAANVKELLPQQAIHKILKSAWRSKFVIPELLKTGVHLYHGLSHEIPNGIHKTNIKSVVTIHDLIFEKYPNQFKAIDRYIYRKKFTYASLNANAVVAISTQTKNDLIEIYNVPEKNIHICYQSCDDIFKQSYAIEDANNFLKKHNLPTEYILYVGSIIERKNVLTIIKALETLETGYQIPLIIVGKGDYYEKEVRAYVATKQLQKSIIFLNDIISDSQYIFSKLPLLYTKAQAFVYPSIYEGFGIPILEAMYCQCPVITSNVSCLPETAGNAGILISPYDTAALAAAIQTLLTDTTLRKQLIYNGNIQAQKFSTANSVQSVMKVYNSLC
jgi:glycosyltransferase involved in cell wall biosynthesis